MTTSYVYLDNLSNNKLDDGDLVQLKEKPIRETNTLDMIITNHPDYFTPVKLIPGICGNNIMYPLLDIRPIVIRTKS